VFLKHLLFYHSKPLIIIFTAIKSIMVSPSLRPLNLQDYAWEQSSQNPALWQRRALAGECVWLPRPKEYHEIFISASLVLESPTSLPILKAAASHSWQLLRFEVPELHVQIICRDDGRQYMKYQTPKDPDEVNQWVHRTFVFEQHSSLQFHELRDQVVSMKASHDSDKAFLLFRVGEEDRDEPVKNVQLMLPVDHQVADGIGIRILLGRYLTLLASSLGQPSNLTHKEINWSESSKNLSTPWISVMNEHQVTSGPEYERASEENREFLHEKMVHPFPSSSNNHCLTSPRITTMAFPFSKPLSHQPRKSIS